MPVVTKEKDKSKDKSSYKLCIGLKPETALLDREDKKPISFDCSHNPGVDGAPTYKIKVYPFEDGYPCEVYLQTLKYVDDIIAGQGLTTNEQKVRVIRQLFDGTSALVAFENEMPNNPTDPITNPMWTRAKVAMTRVIFPVNAARNQKKAMKKIKKPIDMTFAQFAQRMKQLNDWLPLFPPLHNGNAPRAMGRDEFHDVLHDALPRRNYQDEMQRFDFDPTTVTLQEFIDWVTRRCKPFDDKGASQSKLEKTIPKKKRQQSTSDKKDGEPPSKKQKLFCLLHGHGAHTTDQCQVMKARAAELQKEREKKKFPFKKDSKSTNDAHSLEQAKEIFESFLVSEAYSQALTKQVGGICNKLFKGFKRSLEDAGFEQHAMEAENENDAYEALLKLNVDDKPFDESN